MCSVFYFSDILVSDIVEISILIMLDLMDVAFPLYVRWVIRVKEDRATAVLINHACSVASAWERGVKDIDVIVRFYHPLMYNLSKIESEKTPTISLRGSLSVS